MLPTSDGSPSEGAPFSYRELLLNPPMAVLILARTLEPISNTSKYSYMFSQLRWLSPTASAAEIAFQAGLLAASKTAAKCLTGLLWGRLSDKPWGGRRLVLLISFLASCVANLGFGLSRSFAQAVFWQIIEGSMNSAIGIIRCMVAEMETRPKHRARALLLIPMAGSVGQLLGPLLGGFLTQLSGTDILDSYPYLLPNAVTSACYAISFLGIYFLVEETLETFDKRQGSGLRQCCSRLLACVRRQPHKDHAYTSIPNAESDELPDSPQTPTATERISVENVLPLKAKPLTFWQIWTPQVICTLAAHFVIAGHISTFATTGAVFLASPVDASHVEDWSLLRFTGGTGLSPPELGTVMSVFGVLGVALQTLLPRLNDRFGVVAVWRLSLFFFPVAYFVAPYAALAASSSGPVAAWAVIAVMWLLFTIGRTGAQPAMTLLINACIPSPDARGTINVAGTVFGNLSRSIIPVTIMSIYGWGFDHHAVVLGFWVMSALAVVAIVASGWVKETDTVRRKKPALPTTDLEQANRS